MVIDDWDDKSVKLVWQAPIDNGRSPITHYTVEMKTKHGNQWLPCGRSGGSVPEATISGLKTGSEVQFRVRANNKAGLGPASAPTDTHIVKHRYLAPKIDRTNLINVTLKEGQSWHVDADVIGESPPKVEWFFGSGTVPLSNDAHYTIRNRDYHTSFSIDNAQRKHNGRYTIKATNQSGQDEVTIEVKVITRPMPPEELHIGKITSESCEIRYSAPLDDGGEKIDHYVIELQDCETGLWSKAGTTPKERFEITGLTNGHTYRVRVRAVNAIGASDPADGNRSFVGKYHIFKFILSIFN